MLPQSDVLVPIGMDALDPCSVWYERALTILALENMGNLNTGGDFTKSRGVRAEHIAMLNRSRWNPLGMGMNGYIGDFVTDDSGGVFVSGLFTTAGSKPTYYIAEWSEERFIDIYLPQILRYIQ
jgi:hypothetical protein